MDKRKCKQCGKENLSDYLIKSEPNRHACSPNSININKKSEQDKFYLYYCSKECQKKDQDLTYACWAELDKNVNDSECFEGTGWEGNLRVGKCKITGKELKIFPMMPAEASRQPEECTDHFILRKKYRDIIKEYESQR